MKTACDLSRFSPPPSRAPLYSPDLQQHCQDAIRSFLFHKKQKTDPSHMVKIQHSQIDSEMYSKVIRGGIDEDQMNSPVESSNRIYQCYKYFSHALSPSSEEERKTLFNKILDSENKMLVVIDLAEHDDEQTIFDTINSAGVRLSCADIIKNALFQKAIQIFSDKQKVTDLYRQTWEEVFMKDEDSIEYWDTQRLTGRLIRDNIEILLHSIAVIEGIYDPDLHTLSDLSKLYKERIAAFTSEAELKSFIKSIKEYAEIYREMILTFNKSTLFSFADKFKRMFHVFDVLQVSTFHPFILYIFKTHQNNDAEIERLLMSLEKFVVRRIISGKETKSFNKLCKEFIQSPQSIEMKSKETNDEAFANGLLAIQNKNASLLLFWVELQRRHADPRYDVKDLKYDYSLEHVMPQKWEEHWSPVLEKRSADGTLMDPEAAKKDRYAKIYSIGNMTLLTSSLNSSLRNYPFEVKVKGKGRMKGMEKYASLSITREDIVQIVLEGDKIWDEAKIEARTNKLSEEIVNIW